MAINYIEQIRSFNRDVRLYLLAGSLTAFSYVGMYVMLFNLYLVRLGYDLAFIGLINGAAQLGMALFSLPAGMLGRRFTSRRIMIIGLGMITVGLGLLPLAETMPAAWQSTWLMVTYIFAWLGGSLYIVNGNPFLMAITKPAERQYVFSVQLSLTPLSAFAGSLIGGLLPGFFAAALGLSLDQPAAYRYVLFIAATLFLPAMFAVGLTRPQVDSEQPHSRGQYGDSPRPTGLIIFMAAVVLLQVVGQSAADIFFNVYLDKSLEMSTAAIGGLTGFSRLLAVPMALLTPLLVSRWGIGRTITRGILGMAVAMLPLALIPHWGAASFGFMGVVALFTLTAPAFAIAQQEIVPPAWRSTMAGAISMTTGLGTAAVAFGGGYVITDLGYQTFFVAAAVLAAIGGLLFWGFTWVPRYVLLHEAKAAQNL